MAGADTHLDRTQAWRDAATRLEQLRVMRRPEVSPELDPDRHQGTVATWLRHWAELRPDTIAAYKQPEIVIVEAMPMTATGKIRNVELLDTLDAQPAEAAPAEEKTAGARTAEVKAHDAKATRTAGDEQ